jgi:hypothetical protein
MQEVTAQLYPCKHCGESGTCKSGENDSSCHACVKYHELKGKAPFHGLACGTCGGIGQAEPFTDRMNNRIKPMLALGIVFLVLIFTFVLAAFKNQYFTEFLAFSGTLMGAVTAFYFNNSRKR